MSRLGVYGGSFDPPHVAHVLAAAYAQAVGGFDEVVVIPVFAHSFNKSLCAFEHRVRMCELAFADLSRVRVSRIEAELPTPSRTLTTLQALQREKPGSELRLMIGADVLADAGKWYAFDAVLQLAPPFVIGRAGYPDARASACELPGISSTRVRELLARETDAATRGELAQLVPQSVLDYASQHALYSRAAAQSV